MDPVITMTMGKHLLDKRPESVTQGRWSELGSLLREGQQVALPPWRKGAWECADGRHWPSKELVPQGVRVWFRGWPWLAPYERHPQAEGRARDSIQRMSAFAGLDLDTPGWTEARIRDALAGYAVYGHTTTHSRPEAQRWRLYVLLSRTHSLDAHDAVWAYFNDCFEQQLDPQTGDATRILLLPAQWEGADNAWFEMEGYPADVDCMCEEYAGSGRSDLPGVPQAVLEGAAERPAHLPVISEALIARHFKDRPPSGRFFRLMVGAAYRHRKQDWKLTDSDLCAAALDVSHQYAPGVVRVDPQREAQRAIGYAMANAEPDPPVLSKGDERRRLAAMSAVERDAYMAGKTKGGA